MFNLLETGGRKASRMLMHHSDLFHQMAITIYCGHGMILAEIFGIDKKFKGQSKLIFTFYSYTDYPNIKGNSCCFSLSLIIPNLSLIFSMLKKKKKILPLLWSLLLSGWLIISTFLSKS